MSKIKIFYLCFVLVMIFVYSCTNEPVKFVINGTIKGGEGKYIKYISLGKIKPITDSLYVDMGGNFTLSENSNEPVDLLFYFNPQQSIRIIALPNETIKITGRLPHLTESFTVYGSEESELLSQLLKRNKNARYTIDTLNQYYMEQQLNPEINSIVVQLRNMSDSIFRTEKEFLQNFIRNNPSSLASYVALSFKLHSYFNFFSIKEDFEYFQMIDTALLSRYDTITMYKMLHAYIAKNKPLNEKINTKKRILSIGDTVPDISLPNPYGDTLNLSNLKGKYVLIDFWGSWCKPCRTENKNIRSAYIYFRKRGFEVFQVAIERDKNDWKNSIREDRLFWKNQVSDLEYMKSKVAKKYFIDGIPANFLINPNGEIIAKDIREKKLWYELNKALPKAKIVKKDTNTLSH